MECVLCLRMDTDSSTEHGPVIKLTFDHVRKDKKERLYIAEDESSVEVIIFFLTVLRTHIEFTAVHVLS